MNSKWIDEVEQLVDNPDTWEFILPRLKEVDTLLRRAMFELDNDILFYEILEKMDKLNVEISSTKSKIATGVSSVIPVTNEEAERIFKEAEENGN